MAETLSPYLALNVERYAGNATLTLEEQRIAGSLSRATGGVVGGPTGTNTSTLNELGGGFGTFEESNRMHQINGLGWGNLPGLDFKQNEYVRWYQLGLGTFLDIHVLHWHGITAIMEGHRRDTIELFPATFHVADARMDDPGQWMLHCHVNVHFDGGMIAFFRIHKNEHAGVHGHGWGAAAPANFSSVPAPEAIGPVPLSKVIAEASNIRLPDNSTTITTTGKHGARGNATAVSNHGVGTAKSSNKTVWFGKPLPPALKIGMTKLKDHDLRGAVAGKNAGRHESARQVAAKTARHP
ncbi:hypothetical protein AMAG_05193 [Allomyces macrogynus ATCC 38327]|nr:hypothetical protein AMAG_05193 [Allomyces macrogynus ATCC 38327]|eukprot:KNE59729.1 hypothetical protein AMAG_05193 [Allomyces macrogynus ATCC 38327]